MEEVNNNGKLGIIILVLLLIASIGYNAYSVFFKEEKLGCVEKDCNCPTCEENKKEDAITTKPNAQSDYKNVKATAIYRNDFKSAEDSECTFAELHLYNNGTYYDNGCANQDGGNLGTYTLDNGILTLYAYFYTTTGSGLNMYSKVRTTTYYVKEDGLYESNNKQVYKRTSKQEKNSENVLKALYDYLIDGDKLCLSNTDNGIYIDMNC